MDRIFNAHHQQDAVEAGNPQQTQANHQHAGDRTAAECDLHGRIDTVMSRFGSTHIRANRNIHSNVTGKTGENRTDSKANGCRDVQEEGYNRQHHDAHHADGGVLAIEIGARAFLNCGCNFVHSFVAGRFGQDPLHGYHTVTDGNQCAEQRKYQAVSHNSPQFSSSLITGIPESLQIKTGASIDAATGNSPRC